MLFVNVLLFMQRKIRFVEGKVVRKPGDSNHRTFNPILLGMGNFLLLRRWVDDVIEKSNFLCEQQTSHSHYFSKRNVQSAGMRISYSPLFADYKTTAAITSKCHRATYEYFEHFNAIWNNQTLTVLIDSAGHMSWEWVVKQIK